MSEVELKNYAGKRWTEARYLTFVRGALRAAFRKWPPKADALKKAFIEKKLNPKSGREASFYECKMCKGAFVLKDVEVDHIVPVVGHTGFTGWDDYIHRLFRDSRWLQVLCKACHKKKTKTENKLRKKRK